MKNAFFCPFQMIREYLSIRGTEYENDDEQFFILPDGSPLKQYTIRNMLIKLFKCLNLNSSVHSFHCFRIGRSLDLLKFGYTVDQIKLMGRWKSNAVFRYIRP